MQLGHTDLPNANHSGVIRWNAIFAGSLVTLALWGMLYTLGIALGLSTINPDNSTSLRASGFFTGGWSVFSPLVALFCGALFTSRGAAAQTRATGAMHGLVMWSLSTLGFAWLCANLLTGVIDTAMGAGKQAFSLGSRGVAASTQGADAIQGAAASAAELLSNNTGIDTQDVLGAVNARLRDAGRSPIEPAMLSQALKDLAKSGLRQGKVDRQDIIKVLLDNTPLERKDADELSEQIQVQLGASKEKMQNAMAQAKEAATNGAYKTAEIGAKAFWGLFTVLFLGMIASVSGGFLGIRDARHEII